MCSYITYPHGVSVRSSHRQSCFNNRGTKEGGPDEPVPPGGCQGGAPGGGHAVRGGQGGTQVAGSGGSDGQ